jgi:hypothetical protein
LPVRAGRWLTTAVIWWLLIDGEAKTRCVLVRGFYRWRRCPRLHPEEGDRVGRSRADHGECRVNMQASCYCEIRQKKNVSRCAVMGKEG